MIPANRAVDTALVTPATIRMAPGNNNPVAMARATPVTTHTALDKKPEATALANKEADNRAVDTVAMMTHTEVVIWEAILKMVNS